MNGVAPYLAAAVVAMVAAQLAVPGADLYHAGWYNVVLAAFGIWAIARTWRAPLIALGIGAIAFAGVACGLLAPGARTVIGAPGTAVRVDEASTTLVFPLTRGDPPAVKTVRFTMTAFLRSVPRSVVAVDAYDRRGAHLTITQPTGSAFLSPVLLMQNTQSIAGLTLPYDSFAVPAAHCIVKAVLFSQAQAASMPALAAARGPVVLFSVEDDTGAPIANGIGMAPDGGSVAIGGLRLRPRVFTYAAVEVVPIPNLAVLFAGALAILAGLLLTRRSAPG
ncbi:MAG TPA: hypothetical protein VMA98_02160 [Candidatus Acidoferrales bacterium]|nr:hypothetical protein [Candidatus Acidoferrales bacterium]